MTGKAVAVFALVVGAADGVHAAPPPKPAAATPLLISWVPVWGSVEKLRRVLAEPVDDRPSDAARERIRRGMVGRRLDELRTCRELRDALFLTEWRDADADEAIAAADAGMKADLERRLVASVITLLHAPDPGVRAGACGLVAESGARLPPRTCRALTQPLIGLILDREAGVCEPAIVALSRIGPDPRTVVGVFEVIRFQGTSPQRQAAMTALATLIRTAIDRHRSPGTRISPEGRGVVAETACAVSPVAVRALADPDLRVRRLALEALQDAALAIEDLTRAPDSGGETGPDPAGEVALLSPWLRLVPAVGAAVARCSSDPDAGVRTLGYHAAESLGRVEHAAHDYLDRVRPADPEPSPRDATLAPAAVNAWSPGVKPPAGLDSLINGLRDPEVTVRRSALDALETLGARAIPAIGPMIQALGDRDVFVRWAAARAVGKLAPADAARAVPRLAGLLVDRDPDVRLAAATALGQYGPAARVVLPFLGRCVRAGDVDYRLAVLALLERVGPESAAVLPDVCSGLSDPDPRVRRASARFVGRFGPAARTAEPALRVALTDPDPGVRAAAADALIGLSQGQAPGYRVVSVPANPTSAAWRPAAR